jgi:hypothetical protein
MMLPAILEKALHKSTPRSQPRPKKRIEDDVKKKDLLSSIPPPHVTLSVLAKKSNGGQNAECQ